MAAQFIRLSYVSSGREFIANVAYIALASQPNEEATQRGVGCVVFFGGDENYIEVKESYAKVQGLINASNSRA